MQHMIGGSSTYVVFCVSWNAFGLWISCNECLLHDSRCAITFLQVDYVRKKSLQHNNLYLGSNIIESFHQYFFTHLVARNSAATL